MLPLLLLLLLLQLLCSSTSTENSTASVKVLVLGGSGQIGSCTVAALRQLGYHVTSVQRNSSSLWDEQQAASHRFFPCEREVGLDACHSLGEIDRDRFLAVVDLSGHYDLMVMQTAKLMIGRVSLYVFVSSATVYDVSELSGSPGRLVEEDGVIPKDQEVMNRLRSGKDAAYQKLSSEFALQFISADYNGNYDHAIVRLPDTFGARDRTHRLWYYGMLLRKAAQDGEAVLLPNNARGRKMSIAYSANVGEFLADLIDNYRHSRPDQPHFREIYNFAYDADLTLEDFLQELSAAMGLPSAPTFAYSDSAVQLYPSVASGSLSVEKARRHFNATFARMKPLRDALADTWSFYETVEQSWPAKFTQEVDDFLRKLREWGVTYLPDFVANKQ